MTRNFPLLLSLPSNKPISLTPIRSPHPKIISLPIITKTRLFPLAVLAAPTTCVAEQYLIACFYALHCCAYAAYDAGAWRRVSGGVRLRL
jgi:hypothetical protein